RSPIAIARFVTTALSPAAPIAIAIGPPSATIAISIPTTATAIAVSTAVALRALRRLAIARYRNDHGATGQPVDLARHELLHQQLFGREAEEGAGLLEGGLSALGD